ncbi:hypothetical protein LTR66_016052 [Elasticomyces elasticus]|nr:hypothetical protein LTR66_016052 [Elasticomyces elasticus]
MPKLSNSRVLLIGRPSHTRSKCIVSPEGFRASSRALSRSQLSKLEESPEIFTERFKRKGPAGGDDELQTLAGKGKKRKGAGRSLKRKTPLGGDDELQTPQIKSGTEDFKSSKESLRISDSTKRCAAHSRLRNMGDVEQDVEGAGNEDGA